MSNEDEYVFEAHHFGRLKGIPWSVCLKCGHVDFTNHLSMWVRKMGCDAKWHPDWRRVRVSLVRKHQQERNAST
jgi:hypothetical protein